ncbi:MAG: TIGR04282 family arsenosugar biosynthesis glycosyltransferase, partial [Thiotrichaceae bacterium]|nr:TIGR04282 family arsenosugar biosynthesis glycosyltransferase [Thiotrichaceae bacterium]
DSLIIIFARQPIIGQVKTRLIPVLGELGATQLYTRLLDHAINNVLAAKICPLEICITPESDMDYFFSQYNRQKLTLSRQSQGDLGDRMYQAMHLALQNYSKVILIGSDCPFISRAVLVQSVTTLNNHDMVFSPASDGGYVLIGAKNISAAVFENIQWSSEHVMSQSRQRLSAEQISWKELSVQHDIDVAADLNYLPDVLRYGILPDK